MWVIMDRFKKSSHCLVVRMTFTLEEFHKLYIREIFWLHGVLVYSVGPGSQVYSSFLEELSASLKDKVDDEHRFSSPDGRSVIEDHPDI